MSVGVSILRAVIPPDAAGWRLDRALAVAAPTLSRERIKRLIAAGGVTVADIVARDPAARATPGA